MPLEDFIIAVFCWVDERLKALLGDHRLRQRGFAPKLTDSEVITMEMVGEFLDAAMIMARVAQVGGEDRHRFGLALGIDDQHPANRHRPLAGGIPQAGVAEHPNPAGRPAIQGNFQVFPIRQRLLDSRFQ